MRLFYLENLWGNYGPRDMLIEKNQSSEPVQESFEDIRKKPYVFSDISTYFTLMVGIFFPSVTGEGIKDH